MENGISIVDNTTVNSTALYICEEGFSHKDNSLQIEIQCLPDGMWTQIDMECVAGKSWIWEECGWQGSNNLWGGANNL